MSEPEVVAVSCASGIQLRSSWSRDRFLHPPLQAGLDSTCMVPPGAGRYLRIDRAPSSIDPKGRAPADGDAFRSVLHSPLSIGWSGASTHHLLKVMDS